MKVDFQHYAGLIKGGQAALNFKSAGHPPSRCYVKCMAATTTLIPGNRDSYVARLFVRRPRFDALGFLDIDASPELYCVEHLFDQPAAVIVGAPWLGKSYVAQRLHGWLQAQPAEQSFGDYLCLLPFGIHGAESALPPPWWGQWRGSKPPARACWIIDALDEGEERLTCICKRILDLMRGLESPHRARLQLIILSRQREWLSDFQAALEELYVGSLRRTLAEFHLAPLHASAAHDFLGGPEEFERITGLIRQFDLQPIAGYPAALAYLRDHYGDADLSVTNVWRGILQHLLYEPEAHRRRHLRSDYEDRFKATCRLAAVLALTQTEQVVDHTRPLGLPVLSDIFPNGAEPSLRTAGREACEVGPFFSTAEAGYRFTQRNIQDWFAAFGLADLRIEQLRSAICDVRDRIFNRHRDLLPLLRRVSAHEPVQRWIDDLTGGLPLTSDLIGLSLAESLGYIDRLEQLADQGPGDFWLYGDQLARLSAPGLSRELERRLHDAERSVAVKDLLLDIARATDPEAVLPTAVTMVTDPKQSVDLRRRAFVVIARHGGNQHFLSLAGVFDGPADATADRQLRASLLLQLLNRRLWNVMQVVVHAEPADHHVIDDREILLSTIRERLTAEDARVLLEDRRQYCNALRLVVDRFHRTDLFEVALERLLAAGPWSDQDERLLVDVALDPEWRSPDRNYAFQVLHRLSYSSYVRHRLYEYGVELRRREPLAPWAWTLALRTDDWPWLLEQIKQRWTNEPFVWPDLYRLVRSARDAAQMSDTAWEEVHRLIAHHAPDVPSQYEKVQAQAAEVRRLHDEQMRACQHEEPPPTTLRQEILRLLDEFPVNADMRMRRLSYLCFVQALRPGHISGDWEGLDFGLRRRVLTALRTGLEQATPTPIPDSNSFPGNILGEGYAFLQVLEDPEPNSWLTGELVQKWLPSAVFAVYGQIPYLARRCSSVDAASAVAIVLDAAERELRTGAEFAVRADELPQEYWDDSSVIQRVVGWIHNESFHPLARINLLQLLAVRAPGQALPIAAGWSGRPQDLNANGRLLKWAGLNLHLFLDPASAWPLLEGEFQQDGPEVLEAMTTLQDYHHHRQLRADLTNWPLDRLEGLGRLLFAAFPIRSDPPHDGRPITITAAVQLRGTRDHVVGILLRRGTADSQAAVQRLAAIDAELDQRLRNQQANQSAQALLGELPVSTADSSTALSVRAAVRLLDQTEYRLVRNSDDLLEAVCEALEVIAGDIPSDLPMLYQPSKRKKGAVPKRLKEDALQAYLRRRLLDLMPSRIQGFRGCRILREDRVGYRRRLDLRVLAASLPSGELVTVVIEVKWSDNTDTSTSLVKQLGRQYLLGEQLTHGIYLVGWNGRWRKNSGRRQRRLPSKRNLEQFLERQCARFCARAECRTLRIRPVVLDLQWRDVASKR